MAIVERYAARSIQTDRRSTYHFALLCVLSLVVTAPPMASSQSQEPSPHSAQSRTAPLPWYVTSAAIHRVTLKANTKYWRFERLSLNAAKAAAKLRAWKKI